MEEELRAILLATAGVTTLCGNRIDFGANAQGAAYPRIVMFTIGNDVGSTMQGPDSIEFGRVQIDIYAETYAQAKQLSRAVKTTLNHYRGGGFQLVTFESARDSREGGTNEAERPYRVSLDFITRWRT